MTADQFNIFCSSLPHATHVVQWSESHVWKIGGKVFAIAAEREGAFHVSFKCSPLVFELMKDAKGVRPAPYLASRGMIWLQRTSAATLTDAALKDHVRESYRLVSLGLTKATQKSLGLNQDNAARTKGREE
jgi:predicted DNA-binding protein (MmcQ/YjbR family)